MGLAASQARFLGLTARKSNIEYEGQQVNQQRTALAEEVNALYNSLASLALPVAPDATQYYESNYSFSLSNTTGLDGDYLVKSYYKNADGTYYINATRTYNKTVAEGTIINSSAITSAADPDDPTKTIYSYTPEGSETTVPLTASKSSKTVIGTINETYPNSPLSTDDTLLTYTDDTTKQTYYFSLAQIQAGGNISAYTMANKSVTTSEVFEDAKVTFNSNTNRISSISVKKDDNSYYSPADVDTTRIYDSDGYDAALRDYTMSKDEYNRKVQELNARTESLQQEDKILEMRLDQIGTEQNELKTEMEAVKSVLKDNIENTFKTFA